MTKKRRVRIPKISLNENQAAVVAHNDGPLIVTAGPGSGKTRVIVERIARMIHDGTARPESILATTFTKKAAEEMNERLEAKHIDTTRMAVQTTHSFCYRIMRQHRNHRGWKYDEKDRSPIHLKIILGYKEMNWVGVDFTKVVEFISSCRNNLLAPEECDRLLQGEFADSRYKLAYSMWHDRMAEEQLITPDCMLYYGVRLLQQDPKVLSREQGRWLYVMVDEVQDSNYAQTVMADLVAAPEYNLMVVGDEDQGIYAWRGALPEYMLKFEERYTAERITLGINYRCAPAIVHAATSLIEYNEERLPKDLVPHRTTEMNILFRAGESTDDEARLVAEEVESLNLDGISHGAMIVLMRTNAQSRAIEEEFIERSIPFVVLGASSFYERKEIKRLLAYLRVLVDPRDIEYGELSLRSPYRGTSAKAHEFIAHKTKQRGNYIEAVDLAMDRGMFKGQAQYKVVDWVALMNRFDINKDKPNKILQAIVDDTDFLQWLVDEDGSETLESDRVLNVNELIRGAGRFETGHDFIKYIDKQIKLRKRSQRKKGESRVQVMSIHKSKGTEAYAVFLIGANQGIIPHSMGTEEEERRLFYVAMTRAKDYLHVSYITTLIEEGKPVRSAPSQFALEAGIIPSHLTPADDSTTVESSTGVAADESPKEL